MKVLKNETSLVIETWDDPGDYPSGAGAGPLPSYDYVSGIDGAFVVSLTHAEMLEFIAMQHFNREEFNEWLNEWMALPSFDGILSCVWRGSLKGYVLTLEVIEVERDPNWNPSPEDNEEAAYEEFREDRDRGLI